LLGYLIGGCTIKTIGLKTMGWILIFLTMLLFITNIAKAGLKYPFSDISFYIHKKGKPILSGAKVVIIPGIEIDPGTDTVIISYNPSEKVWSIGSYRSRPNGKHDIAVIIAYDEVRDTYTYTRKYERLGVRSASIAEPHALTIAGNIWEDVLKSKKLK